MRWPRRRGVSGFLRRPGTPEPADIGVDVPRPSHWGGFSLRIEAIELWVEGEFRIHDRARWTRKVALAGAGDGDGDGWTGTRLQP